MSVAFRALGVVVGCGLGAAVGWVVGRLPTRAALQDLSAIVIGWVVGSVAAIGAAVGQLMSRATGSGGLGAVSAGLSDALLVGLPIAMLVLGFIGGRWLRRQLVSSHSVPVILGAIGALLGALSIATTLSMS